MKKNLVLISLFVITMLVINTNAFTQVSNFHIGLVLPNSDWGDDDVDDEDSGLQGTGFNLGFEGIIPLSDNGLGIFLGADVNYTQLKKDVRDDIEDANEDADIKFPKTFVIPLSAGLCYNFKPNEKIALFGKGGVSLSLLKFTNLEIDDDATYTEKYKIANNFGLNLGGGIVFNDKTVVAINYFGLGEHTIKGEYENSGYYDESGDIDKMKKKISFVTLTVGIKL